MKLEYARFDGKTFSLRPKLMDLGYAFLSSFPLTKAVEPHVKNLVGNLNESAVVGVLDRNELVYVTRIATKRIMTLEVPVGSRFPPYATSMGRILLGGLDEYELDRYLETTHLQPLTGNTNIDPIKLKKIITDAKKWLHHHRPGTRGRAKIDRRSNTESQWNNYGLNTCLFPCIKSHIGQIEERVPARPANRSPRNRK